MTAGGERDERVGGIPGREGGRAEEGEEGGGGGLERLAVTHRC